MSTTRDPADQANGPADAGAPEPERRWTAGPIVFVLLLVAPFVLAGVVIVAVTALDRATDDASSTATTAASLDRAPETLSYTIPSGTAARMERGEIVSDVMPEYLNLVRGDTIVVDNQDSATHRFGPIVVRPGESTTVTFYEPGRYQGVCTVGTHDTVTIDVT